MSKAIKNKVPILNALAKLRLETHTLEITIHNTYQEKRLNKPTVFHLRRLASQLNCTAQQLESLYLGEETDSVTV